MIVVTEVEDVIRNSPHRFYSINGQVLFPIMASADGSITYGLIAYLEREKHTPGAPVSMENLGRGGTLRVMRDRMTLAVEFDRGFSLEEATRTLEEAAQVLEAA